MLNITIQPDCGNAPKKEFLKDFNIAFAKGDIDTLLNSISDDMVWNIIGDKTITGKEHFSQEMEQMTANEVSELTIFSIVTHGIEAAVYGSMKMANGYEYAFSDFYKFSNANGEKIASMSSFVIKI